jgi:hypothetical protein
MFAKRNKTVFIVAWLSVMAMVATLVSFPTASGATSYPGGVHLSAAVVTPSSTMSGMWTYISVSGCDQFNCYEAGTRDNYTNWATQAVVETGTSALVTTTVIAAPDGGSSTDTQSLSCTHTSCVLLGTYVPSGANYVKNFIATDNGGQWLARALPLANSIRLSGISCSGGQCIAAGSDYNQVTHSTTALIATGTVTGSWTTQTVSSSISGDTSSLGSISCIGSVCEAGGSELNPGQDGSNIAMIASNATGRWTESVLQRNGQPIVGSVDGLSCSSTAHCAAVGSEYSPSSEGFAAMLEPSGWSVATVSAPKGTGRAQPGFVTCVNTSCYLSGFYLDTSGNDQGFVASNTAGTWISEAETPPTGSQASYLGSVGCNDQICVVGGYALSSQNYVGQLTTFVPLGFASSTLPAATLGNRYASNLGAVGGSGHLTYSLLSGALPTGLSLNTATGSITGSPTTTGTSTFTVSVADSEDGPLVAQATMTLEVEAPLLSSAHGVRTTAGTTNVFTVSGFAVHTKLALTVAGVPIGSVISSVSGALVMHFTWGNQILRMNNVYGIKVPTGRFTVTLAGPSPSGNRRHISAEFNFAKV